MRYEVLERYKGNGHNPFGIQDGTPTKVHIEAELAKTKPLYKRICE